MSFSTISNIRKHLPQGTVVIQSAIDNRYITYYLLVVTLSTTFFWTVSCFTNFLPTPSNLYSQKVRIRYYIHLALLRDILFNDTSIVMVPAERHSVSILPFHATDVQ